MAQQVAHPKTAHSPWKWLHIISGVCALITAVIIPLSIIAFFIWPTFPDDLFTIVQNDRFAGLMSLDFPYLAGNFFAIPVFLSLYITLKRTSESFSLLALALGLIGLVMLVPARPIFEMLALSDQYAAATTAAQRTEIMAAWRATLAFFRGTAFNVHYVLGSLSLLISSAVMLRSNIFSKATAYVGLVTNVLVFTLYVPVIGVYLSILSVVGYLIWWLQIAQTLLRLANSDKPVKGRAAV